MRSASLTLGRVATVRSDEVQHAVDVESRPDQLRCHGPVGDSSPRPINCRMSRQYATRALLVAQSSMAARDIARKLHPLLDGFT